MTTETKQILEELKAIRSELHYIKEHIVDVDTILTNEDREALDQAEKDLKHGKTKRLI